MAGLTNSILTQIANKRLAGKAMVNGRSTITQEKFGSFIQQSNTTIFGTPLPNNPSQTEWLIQSASGESSDQGSVMFVEFDLIPIGGYYQNSSGNDGNSLLAEQEVFNYDLGDTNAYNTLTYHAYALKLPINFEDSASEAGFNSKAATSTVLGNDPFSNGFISTGSNQFQLVPEYVSTVTGVDNAYIPKLYDFDSDISVNNDIAYYLDTAAGILFVQNPPGEALDSSIQDNPLTVKAFLYVGQYQDEISGGGTGEGFPYTGDAVITGSLLVSGSSPTVTVTGSVEVTNGITGSLYGTASFATGLVPELFEIPELLGGITGSGLVISSSGLPPNTYNSIRIGSTEFINLGNSFLINLDSAAAFTFSGSSGAISYMAQDAFNLYQNDGIKRVFAFDTSAFNIFPDNSVTTLFTVSRNTGNTYISGTLQVANLPQEDSLVRVITSDANGNLAYTSSAYFAPSTAVNILSSLYTSLNDEVTDNTSAISTLTSQTSSYIIEAETGSMLEPYLLSSQTGSPGFNELVINNGSGGGDLTVNGNLYVYGDATELQVSKLQVEDRFILLNSGSLGNIYEGGIIVQTNANGSGSAIFYENTTNRWMVAQSSSVAADETNITVSGTTDYIVTVSASAGSPVGVPPNFGNGNDNVSVGQMYVDLTAHDIYIYA